MSDTTSIPFKEKLSSDVSLQKIDWWRPASRFVIVQYAVNGVAQEFGKRLDLDKQAFLDDFDDTELDVKLRSLVPAIISAVAARRNGDG